MKKTIKSKDREKPKVAVKKAPASERSKAEHKKLGEHIKSFREELLKKKAALAKYIRSELSELEAADKHHLADLEEMASDTNETDSVCEIMAVGASTINQIDIALTKLDQGTYGACEDCGEPISFDRLEALPFAILCIACQRKREVAR